MSFTLGIVSPVDALQGPGVFLYLKVYYLYDCQMILLHCPLRPGDLSGSQTHGPLFMEETDVVQDEEYVGRQPPASPTYPNMDQWTTPPMYSHPFHGQTNSQLTTLLESQKQVLSMLKDMGQRLCTVESSVSALKAQVNSGSSCCSSTEEKRRVPAQLTVSVKMHNL